MKQTADDAFAPPDWLAAWLDHVPRGRCLDLGAGEGGLSRFLHERGFEVMAVEQNSEALEALASAAASTGFNVATQDIAQFHPKAEEYALIMASAVLHFIPPPQLPDLAQRLIGGLEQGGFLMADVFTVDDPSYRIRKSQQQPLDRNTFKLEGDPGLIHYFDPAELRRLFEPLQLLMYAEDRRLDPLSPWGYRAGASLVARRFSR